MSVLSREATNTNFIVFGLTWLGFKPTIYHSKQAHAVFALIIFTYFPESQNKFSLIPNPVLLVPGFVQVG